MIIKTNNGLIGFEKKKEPEKEPDLEVGGMVKLTDQILADGLLMVHEALPALLLTFPIDEKGGMSFNIQPVGANPTEKPENVTEH